MVFSTICCIFARQPPGGPRPLQIKAAAVAVHVQHLAAAVQPRHTAALHGLRAELIGTQAARRHLMCADEEKMCGQAAMALSDTGLSVRREGGHTPHYVPKEHKVVKGLVKVYSEVTGKEGYAFAIGGGTYSRCMPNTVAFGFNFPGDTDTCHMPDEYVDIDKLMLSVKIFAHALAELAGAEA